MTTIINPLYTQLSNESRCQLFIHIFLPFSVFYARAQPQQQTNDQWLLTNDQLTRLNQALVPKHQQYDSTEWMLRTPFSSPGYATQLKGGMVHSTLESLKYAVALMDTGNENFRLRAIDIFNRVIDLQDQDPASHTYGLWSWFLEEPLDKMAPPDWNWADFCGAQLLEAVLTHSNRFPADLAEKMKSAIIHAARSIERRNVTLSYTNIAIMGTFVTLVAAQTYQLNDLTSYAQKRLTFFYDYTKANGAFTEYNSPNYTIVALDELSLMKQYVKNPLALSMINELYTLTWEDIALHFHVPTHQWAGPHSRSYSSLLNSSVLALFQRATGQNLGSAPPKPTLDEYRLIHVCPTRLIPYFIELTRPRQLIKSLYNLSSDHYNAEYALLKSENKNSSSRKQIEDSLITALVSTTYLHPIYSLGTINRSDLWNQRRSLIAYWGIAQAPTYLHLRFLHDNYDFSAAQFFSIQEKGQVLAGINFATDGGDTHIVIDPLKNASFQAKDLRLRFEFGGFVDGLIMQTPKSLQESAVLTIGETTLSLTVPFATFGSLEGHWESGQDKDKRWLDVVLYAGQQQTFNLSELAKAGLGITVEFGSQSTKSVSLKSADNRLSLQWANLNLQIPLKPARQAELNKMFTATK